MEGIVIAYTCMGILVGARWVRDDLAKDAESIEHKCFIFLSSGFLWPLTIIELFQRGKMP